MADRNTESLKLMSAGELGVAAAPEIATGARASRRSVLRSRMFGEWMAMLVSLAILGGYFGWEIYQDYLGQTIQTRERLTTHAALIERNMAPQLVSANRALEGILADLPDWLARNDDPHRINKRLADRTDILTGVSALMIVNEQGRIIASNLDRLIGFDASGREYFQLARKQHGQHLLHVTQPFVNASGNLSISLVRGITRPDGSFGGVVLAALDPAFFSVLLESARYADDAWAYFAHGDGKLFLTSPDRPGVAGQDLTSTTTLFTRHLASGVASNFYDDTVYVVRKRQLVAIRTIRLPVLRMDKPLLVAVARDPDAIYAEWRHNLMLHLLTFAATAIVAVLGLLLYQRRHRAYELEAELFQAARDQALNDLAQSERKFRVLTQFVPVGIFETNPLGKLAYVNERFCQITGLTPARAVDEGWLACVHPDDAERVLNSWQSLMEARALSGTLEVRVLRPDGQIAWALVHVEAQTNGRNDHLINGFLGCVTDISVLKAAQEALQQLNSDLEGRVFERTAALSDALRAAEAANRAKSEFLSSMSHELRTPLNAVLGYAELFASDPELDSEKRENAREIERAGNLLLTLITDVLDLASIESEAIVLKLEPVPLSGLADQVFQMLADVAEHSSVALINDHGDGESAVILADQTRLIRVLSNFISNGIKYNQPQGYVRVSHILLRRRVRITVTDSGPGIPADKQQRIFTAFDRLGLESGLIEGTGIGLLMCKRITETMGGAIGFTSVEGEGSTFWAEFPLAESA